MNVIVYPFRAEGTISVPSSKSELHRSLIAAALADGPTEVKCRNLSDDVIATIRCLNALGAQIETGTDSILVQPISFDQRRSLPILDCGESGSTLRFLTPVASALGGASFTGAGRLPQRPMSDLIDVMTEHGAEFSQPSLPFRVTGRMIGGEFHLPGNVSSQYLTGLMLAAPLLGETRILIDGPLQSASYIRMTAKTLEQFEIKAEVKSQEIYIPAGQRYHSPGTVYMGADWSGAAFPLCLGALGGPVSISNISTHSAQGDRCIIDLLEQAGASVSKDRMSVSTEHERLNGITVDVSDIPDLMPVLAAMLMHANGCSVFTNAGRLRYKESDRLMTTCAMVNALRGKACIDGDRLIVEGTDRPIGGTVDGAGDHRIVMAAFIGASACSGPSTITHAEASAKSWPTFLDDMKLLGGNLDVVNLR